MKRASQSTFQSTLRKAECHLSSVCPRLANWIHEQGPCDLVPDTGREPYESLVRAVAHQQLHGKAAESILKRLTDRFPGQTFPTPLQLSRLRVPSYRACGFSFAKTETIRAIARGKLAEEIPDAATSMTLSDDALIEMLTQFKGIGKWTVEMFLIFTMGRLDVMPVDDFGVKAGLMHLYELPEMPKKTAFAIHTSTWSPYRSVGAWYLWRLADARKR